MTSTTGYNIVEFINFVSTSHFIINKMSMITIPQLAVKYIFLLFNWTVVVAQLSDRLPPTPEGLDSELAMDHSQTT